MNINDVATPDNTITAAQPNWSGFTANAENVQGQAPRRRQHAQYGKARQQRLGCF
ncbi:hypothetical protein [Janthinobacterium sp. FT14W]|uniref:hypothetical protein n=1 Tax=Janthinobacterium sp. FT14W TaxID=2654253 RepID=UPI00186AC44E|nr:hypothetical protein [Janthinobacterium sp. FT14W]